MDMWPKLELTDYERKFVRPYKTKDYPGVLRRTYNRIIGNDNNLAARPGIKPSEQVQISRRARVFGLTFAGGLSSTRLQITNASGTLYNVPDARTGKYPYVSSIIPGTPYMDNSSVGMLQPPTTQGMNEGTLTQDNIVMSGESGILILDPNWVLVPNETLIFKGNWDDLSDSVDVFLDITLHVWEFPGMGTADLEVREVV